MKPLGYLKANTITKAISKCIDEAHHFNKWGYWNPRTPAPLLIQPPRQSLQKVGPLERTKANTITDTSVKTNILINRATWIPENKNHSWYKRQDNHFTKWGHWNPRPPIPLGIQVLNTATKAIILINRATGTPASQLHYWHNWRNALFHKWCHWNHRKPKPCLIQVFKQSVWQMGPLGSPKANTTTDTIIALAVVSIAVLAFGGSDCATY